MKSHWTESSIDPVWSGYRYPVRDSVENLRRKKVVGPSIRVSFLYRPSLDVCPSDRRLSFLEETPGEVCGWVFVLYSVLTK